MIKRGQALLLAMLLALLWAVPGLAAAPQIHEVDYEGKGIVDVEFTTENVTYENPSVVVRGPNGKKLKAQILEKDNDDIRFRIHGFKAATKYTFTITGLRAGQIGDFGQVKGSFRTFATKPEIEKIIYDWKDKEIEVDFRTRVQYRKLKVTVTDAVGAKLKVKKIKKGSDDLDIKVFGIKAGQKYTVTISGVRVKGQKKYYTIRKAFTAK